MKITICGSMVFAKEMEKYKSELETLGFEVAIPNETENFDYNNSTTKISAERKIKYDFIKKHYKEIKDSEAILVVNLDKNKVKNYIGGNTFLELGFAFTDNKDIFLINPSPDLSYKSEIDAMQPIIINNDLNIIKEYYSKLSQVIISSENKLKINAVSMALRKHVLKYSIEGIKTLSLVKEQPMSVQECYDGALNRLIDIKSKISKTYEYLISIESGLAFLINNMNFFGASVCIIENKAGRREVAVTADIEIPNTMTDLVPSVYPDLGILVQQKYGYKYKDPYLYITNGKLSRSKSLEDIVFTALSKF